MAKSKVNPAPTLLRPGSPESIAYHKKRDKKREVWRARVSHLTHDDLVELAVSGAEVVEILQKSIGDLKEKINKEKSNRRKGADAAKRPKREAKAMIRAKWEQIQKTTPERFHAPTFEKKMLVEFPAIIDGRSIRRWCNEWEREWNRPQTDIREHPDMDLEVEPLRLLGLFSRI